MTVTTSAPMSTSIPPTASRLSPETLLRVYDLMVKSRVLEERLITMYKQGDGYFWIGGPGEEAFNIPLGLLVDKGQGLDHDYLHLHYRSSGTLLAMGANPIASLMSSIGRFSSALYVITRGDCGATSRHDSSAAHLTRVPSR